MEHFVQTSKVTRFDRVPVQFWLKVPYKWGGVCFRRSATPAITRGGGTQHSQVLEPNIHPHGMTENNQICHNDQTRWMFYRVQHARGSMANNYFLAIILRNDLYCVEWDVKP